MTLTQKIMKCSHMTADRLPAVPKDFPIYAVVGMYCQQVMGDFVQHVAILCSASQSSLTSGSSMEKGMILLSSRN